MLTQDVTDVGRAGETEYADDIVRRSNYGSSTSAYGSRSHLGVTSMRRRTWRTASGPAIKSRLDG